MCCPELEVFKPYFSKLVESISHPEQLAIQLYSQDMISKAVRDEAMHIMGSPAPYRASKLVAAVEDQIMVNPPVLHKFLSVVRGDPSLVYIADAMCDFYRECIISSACVLLWLLEILHSPFEILHCGFKVDFYST